MKTKQKIAEKQVRIQEEMQSAGFNVVTCGHCGTVLLHRTGETRIVSVSLLRNKAKEYAKFKHQDEYNDPIYHRDVLETLNDFEAGYKAALKDCNER